MSAPLLRITREKAKAIIAERPDKPSPYLRLFWRSVRRNCPPGRKLELLRAMADIRVRGAYSPEGTLKAKPKRRYEMRKDFNANAGGFDTDHPCFVCDGPEWHHRHHIIQIQHGGGNKWFNIVRLCRSCHRAVHKSI